MPFSGKMGFLFMIAHQTGPMPKKKNQTLVARAPALIAHLAIHPIGGHWALTPFPSVMNNPLQIIYMSAFSPVYLLARVKYKLLRGCLARQ